MITSKPRRSSQTRVRAFLPSSTRWKINHIRLLILSLVGLLAGAGCAASRAYSRGMQAQRAGRPADAVEYLERAVEHDPGNPSYAAALRRARTKLAEAAIAEGEDLERRGEYVLAYRKYRTSFQLDPLNGHALLKRELASIRLRLMDESHRSVARAAVRPASPAAPDTHTISVAGAERSGAVERASSIPSAASRAATIRFEPARIEAAAGKEFSASVIVSARTWPDYGSFDVVYDDRALSLRNVEPGATVATYSLRQPEAGRISLRFHPEKDFDGLVCALVMVAKAPEPGALTVDNARLKDGLGAELDVTTSSASIRAHPVGADAASSTPARR
ncbi:MAG: hypothetical protein AB1714_16885 [Acidobacteriota bacterium]